MSGFKRRARVLFLAGRYPVLAALALKWARLEAAEWLDCRAASMVAADSMADLPLPESWQPDMLSQFDLLVAVDEAVPPMPLPSGVQRRNYSFEVGGLDSATAVALEQASDKARQRILGMVGGMRLLQKAAVE